MENKPVSNDNFGQELDRKMWITKGVRFNAHQRLMSNYIWSIGTIAYLSILVIIITLIKYLPSISLSANQNDVIDFSSIVLALFILILSLLEASKSLQMKAMEFHNCARDISKLYNKLRHTLTNSSDIDKGIISKQLVEIASEYDNILNRCQENHDHIDFDVFRLQHKEDFNLGFIERMKIHINNMVMNYLRYLAISIIFTFTIIFLLVFI